MPDLPSQADIVIVGAGVSGLYCAWRILKDDQKHDRQRSIVIVERLNRTGGRLDTDLITIEDESGNATSTIREEEGGMRFNYHMVELQTLFKALDLCDDIVPFPMSTGAPENDPRRYFYRGKGFTVADANRDPHIWSTIYTLAPDEQGKAPTALLSEAYHAILDANAWTAPEFPTPDYWQRFRLECTWKEVTLNQWTLWGLLRDMGYTEESITMMVHSIGFEGPFQSLMNAGEAFQLLEDFPTNPTYFTLREGFSTLPNALRDEVMAMGGQIFLGANVDAIEGATGDFTLHLTEVPLGESSDPTPYAPGHSTASICSDHVILAVARKALQILFATSPALNTSDDADTLWMDLQTTTEQRLMKINLYFEEAWWERTNGITFGPSYSDLPVNSVYPFYPLDGHSARNPAALTIYCDFTNTYFWQGLQNVGPKFSSPLQEEHDRAVPQVLFPASEAVVEEVLRQFKALFDTQDVPRPVMTSFRNWDGEDDFGYAVHQWGIGAQDDEVMKRLAEPITGLYTCNEAYSDMQGWVNGSLRSSDLALGRIGLPPITEAFGSQCEDSDAG